MAKYSKRVAAALQTLIPDFESLDALPALKSLSLVIFFSPQGDNTEISVRYAKATDRSHLTAGTPAP